MSAADKAGTHGNPVSEPLDIIIVTGALDSLDGEVGGEEPSDEVGDGGSESVDEDQEGEEGDSSDSAISLGNVGLLLELVGKGVPGELKSDVL